MMQPKRFLVCTTSLRLRFFLNQKNLLIFFVRFFSTTYLRLLVLLFL